MMKIQVMEAAFHDAHNWVNNTGEWRGALERDGQVTFEEAVKKRFVCSYKLVDVMAAERVSAHLRASIDTMTMGPSSSSSLSEEDDENNPATTRAKDVEEEEATTSRAEDFEEDVEEENASKDKKAE
jgi:hypothetical protein